MGKDDKNNGREYRKEKSFEQIFRDFKRHSKEISDEMKQRDHYRKPSEIRRDKINKAKRKKKNKNFSSDYNDKPFVDDKY